MSSFSGAHAAEWVCESLFVFGAVPQSESVRDTCGAGPWPRVALREAVLLTGHAAVCLCEVQVYADNTFVSYQQIWS